MLFGTYSFFKGVDCTNVCNCDVAGKCLEAGGMKLNIEIDKNQGRWTKTDGGRKLSFEHHYILGKPLR